MNWVPTTLLFFFAWLAVFAGTQFAVVTSLLGTPVTLVPALLVYAALTNHLAVITGLSVFAGLGLDSLSNNLPGATVLPLFLAAWLIQNQRHVILRDQTYAQFWLGAGTGLFVPLGTLALMRLNDQQPLTGWATLWHLFVGAVFNGLMCPACFRLFDRLRRTFDYEPVPESSFRPDREIKRGRM